MKRGLRWSALALATATVAAPAWAEHAAARRIDEAVGGCTLDDCEHGIDIDFRGMSLYGAAFELRGHSLHAQHLRVEPRLDGLFVFVDGLDARLERPKAPKPAATTKDPIPSAPAAPPDPGFEVPIHIQTSGQVRMDGPAGLEVIVSDPKLDIDATGKVTAQLAAILTRGHQTLVRIPQLEAHGDSLRGRKWSLEGTVGLLEGDAVPMRAQLATDRVSADVASRGGAAHLEASWADEPWADIEARGFGLGFVSLASLLPESARVDLEEAVLDGSLRLEKRGSAVSLDADELRVSGVVVDAPSLSKDPLYMQPIGVDGELRLDADSLHTDLRLSHGQIETEASGTLSREAVRARVQLAPLPCQALLESMPQGFVPVLEGMQLMGEVDALASVEFEFSEIERRRALEDDDAELPTEPPGEIELDFPFLDQCEVVRDAPGIDLESLDGNYRHRFLSAAGREDSRILAAGAHDFVTIAGAPHVARAFVIMEDSRFWLHDGFDREQIERAFWHNLGVKGFRRGASTITQQTARNLWLGHERSLGRKLQEAVLTSRLEAALGKRRILEIYMNIIELGPEVHGVADAARYHFDRPAHDLNVIESLYIAALAPAPVTYSRRDDDGEVDPKWREKLEQQVRRMQLHHMITRERAVTAVREPLRLRNRSAE